MKYCNYLKTEISNFFIMIFCSLEQVAQDFRVDEVVFKVLHLQGVVVQGSENFFSNRLHTISHPNSHQLIQNL